MRSDGPPAVAGGLRERLRSSREDYPGSLVTVSPARAVPDCTILA